MRSFRSTLRFLKNNAVQFARLSKIPQTEMETYCIRHAHTADHSAILDLYKLNVGRLPSGTQQLVLSLLGTRACFVAVTPDELMGFALFYFDQRDIAENTIHAGYIAVSPNHNGRGIGTALWRAAIAHFSFCRLGGISSTVDAANGAALAAGRKVGFFIRETFFDKTSGCERHYLTCRFRGETE